jgi:CBS domain containing-hemolysin-like protein
MIYFIISLVFITIGSFLETSIKSIDNEKDYISKIKYILKNKDQFLISFIFYYLIFLIIYLLGRNSYLNSNFDYYILIIFSGYLIPKIFTYPKLINYTYYYIYFIFYLLYPLSILIKLFYDFFRKIFKSEVKHHVVREDIMNLIEETEEDEIDSTEKDLIENVIEFNEKTIQDIYTPRTNVTWINIKNTVEEIKNIFIQTGYSRLPVTDDDVDHVLGVINFKDFFKEVLENGLSLKDIIDKPIYLTEHVDIDNALKELKEKKNHLAIVIDDFGGTLGIVSLEDILEEIVGEIYDEHDDDIKELDFNSYIVPGYYSYLKVFDDFNIPLDTELLSEKDYTSVGGLIMDLLNDCDVLKKEIVYNGLRFNVLEVDGFKITKVKVKKDK